MCAADVRLDHNDGGNIRVRDLTRNWSVDKKNEFLAWNWARVVLWGLRLGFVAAVTFMEDKYNKVEQDPPPKNSKFTDAFTIDDDDYDEQLQDV